jgi:hypothetical protein
MPRGDKSSYTSKQKREAEHIEESYKRKGVSAKTAASRAWATVNKQDGGGRKKPAKKAAKKSAARKVVKKSATKGATKKKSTRRTHSATAKKAARTRTRQN